MITPIRLYLVDRVTGKKTGKKRDYASIETFNKYGLETYDRYNREFSLNGNPTGTKAEVRYFSKGKWELFSDHELRLLLKGFLTDK